MATDPAPEHQHLAELIGMLRSETQQGFRDLKDELGNRVHVDVYDAYRQLVEIQLQAQTNQITALHKELADARTQRAADRRMVYGALIAAALAMLLRIFELFTQ